MTEIWDVIVVGAGPAGLSATLYASRAGLATLLITGDVPGGLLTTTETVDNYLGMPETSGDTMAKAFLDHALKFGAERRSDVVEHIYKSNGHFTVHTGGRKELTAKSVIYAAGSTPRKLNIPGEDFSGVSYCATCDGLFTEDEDVVLVGGGETAAEDALYLSGMSKSVTVLVRRDHWRASGPAVDRLQERENVHIRMETEIDEIYGEKVTFGMFENVKVTGVKLNTGEELDVAGVYIAVGQTPNSAPAQDVSVLYSDGFIDESLHDGFFVAGDVKSGAHRQVVIAAGEGAKSAIDATNYVLQQQ